MRRERRDAAMARQVIAEHREPLDLIRTRHTLSYPIQCRESVRTALFQTAHQGVLLATDRVR